MKKLLTIAILAIALVPVATAATRGWVSVKIGDQIIFDVAKQTPYGSSMHCKAIMYQGEPSIRCEDGGDYRGRYGTIFNYKGATIIRYKPFKDFRYTPFTVVAHYANTSENALTAG